MDATISAATPANIPTTYTNSRTDTSKAAGGGFQSALADSAPDRGRAQTSSDSSTTTDTASGDTSATLVRSSVTKTTAQNGNAGTNGGDGQQSVLTEDGAAEVLAGASTDGSTVATPTSSSSKDAGTALAKLMAALAREANAGTAGQDDTAKDPATAVPDGSKVAKTTTQDQTKVDDQQVLATLIGAEQAAGDGAVTETGAKPTVKTNTQDKTKISDTDESKATAETPKEGTAGVQDVLSLLGQAAAAQVSATTSNTAGAVTADDAAKVTIDDKLGSGIAPKVKSDVITKTSDSTTQTAAATGAGQTARTSSVADALHMVSGSGHTAGSSTEETLTVADSSSLVDADRLQGVDVLDSRRIIAPVSTSNGANIAATMAGDGEWSSTLRSAAATDVSTTDKLTTDKTLNTLSIKMTPESLGNVTANLKLVDGQLTVSLVVENSSAYRKLHEDQGELMKSLKAQGFGVDQIQISIASPEKSTNDASQNNSQNQTSSQQQAQQNSGGFSQGNNRQQAQPGFENYGQTSGGLVDDTTPSGSVGNSSSNAGAGGQLYL